jgi:hypothetical protein
MRTKFKETRDFTVAKGHGHPLVYFKKQTDFKYPFLKLKTYCKK